MKYIIVLLLIISSHSFSQNEDNVIKPRIEFIKLDSKNRPTNELPYTISNKDTFYIEEHQFKTINDFQYDKTKTPDLIEHYDASVFFRSSKYSKKVYRLLQWKVPLVIYFDKAIPNTIKKKVKAFYAATDSIQNLSITYTKNINKANYRIIITDESYNHDPEDFGITDLLEKQKFFFNNCSYSLVKENNVSIIGCTMKINRKQLDSDDVLLTNIKQGLFLSLGRFYFNYYLTSENSLTSVIYENKAVLSDLDVSLLRLHYFQIYDRRLNSTDFFSLIKLN